MAHYRKPLAAALGLNTTIFVVEGAAGYQSGSLSLVMDAVHNFSDEMALLLLFLAFILSREISRNLVRSANLFNSVGLVAVSALLVWHAFERLADPVPVHGAVPIVIGLLAALGNWGVARLLEGPGRRSAAIRLAYIHNLGDVFVSLAPVLAGLLISLTGQAFFDPAIALGVALWIVAATVREIVRGGEELIWPGRITCGHSDRGETAAQASSSR